MPDKPRDFIDASKKIKTPSIKPLQNSNNRFIKGYEGSETRRPGNVNRGIRPETVRSISPRIIL
ncbi:hypothetical protein POPTR_006G254450v4 [Populus trichocarpa]|uniref:Uncharacterized protein n=1 Tax=Populus trichocarpa TaxID=3694 RepID=A0ACC0SX98_POPTR|nr:hypothetical protein POPTR_006G254450v4 [Populus trichocarpa]